MHFQLTVLRRVESKQVRTIGTRIEVDIQNLSTRIRDLEATKRNDSKHSGSLHATLGDETDYFYSLRRFLTRTSSMLSLSSESARNVREEALEEPSTKSHGGIPLGTVIRLV